MATWKIHITRLITWLLCLTTVPSRADVLPACLAKDFHYEFTECDETGGRWRVSVPKPGTCIGGAPNPPSRDNCTTSCEPGWYLDKDVLHCQACASGSYSLGGGLQIDSWTELPKGFFVSQEPFGTNFHFLQGNNFDAPINCSEYAWRPQGSFISSQGGPCSSMLSYNVRIVKKGAISFVYQYTDDNVLFTFEAQNDRCQSVNQAEKFKWPPKTEEGAWHTLTVPLSMGLNILYWKTIGVGAGEYYGRSPRPVRIRSVTISGVAYTSECSLCPAGTHSSAGSKHCLSCPADTYAPKGSPDCKPCPQDTHYAPEGSERCVERPACTKLDYYKVYSVCDEHNQSTVTYFWRTPKICRDDHALSVALPPMEKNDGCMECNPGMEQSKFSNCTTCPPNTFSKGINKCQKCPASTSPNYELNYKVWHDIPPFMNSRCISFEESGCGGGEAWLPQDGYIQSGPGHGNDTYLVLTLEVSGFRNKEKVVNGQTTEVGVISFSFELVCSTACDFVFMESSRRNNLNIVNNWKGSQTKQHFSYAIRRNDTYLFTWAFQKFPMDQAASPGSTSGNLSGVDLNGDAAIIYDISVTNTVTGGASACLPCPKGAESAGCIPCPPGHYLERGSCMRCPSNTYVSDRLPYGAKSCKPCGAGLRSNDGQSCYSDCTFMMNYQEWASFTQLPRFVQVKGGTQFTSTGMQFYHVFNISLCGSPRPETVCRNNVTLSSQQMEVVSMVCRSTIVPSQGDLESHAVSTQSVSIGDWLIGVTRKPSYQNVHVIDEFGKDSESSSDIHFYYIASSRTPACPTGRNTTVTLRCDKLSKDPGEMSTPKACPDGTCDGCSFHFLWKTRRACRVCTENDYEVVKGECNRGVQTLHYISPKDCIPQQEEGHEGAKPPTRTQMCSTIPFELQMLIAASVGFGVLLLTLVLYCWKKNRKLEYKYMKLVQSGSGKDGELPSAESCAIYDDDDDQYDAVVSDRKSHGLLSKFPGRQSSQDDSERIYLTKNPTQL